MDASERVARLVVPAFARAELLTVRVPFLQPFATSSHTWSCKEALLLRLEGGGRTGWGECVADPDPFYSPETTTSAAHVIGEYLMPLVEAGITFGELDARVSRVRGNRMARATVENALLDLAAKQAGRPLHALLGLPARPVPSGISIGLQASLGALLEAVADAVGAGYHRVKIKIRRGQDVEWAAAVRERFPALPLMVDANGDYTLADAAHLSRLDALGLTMVEQPLSYDDVFEHAALQRQIATPLCLDESLHSLADVRAALDLGACRVVNVKQGRVGGLLEALRIAEHCAARGVPVWSGGMDETGIGRAVNIHLQCAEGFTLPGDTSETRRYFAEDLVEPPVVLGPGGWIEVPQGPGIGVDVLAGRLARFAIAVERLR